jgi:hypothetical protein
MMAGKAKDLTGQRFGRLIVLSQGPTRQGPGIKSEWTQWWCLCDCGVEKLKGRSELIKGKTKSCGCLKREYDASGRSTNRTHGYSSGRSRTPTYRSWQNMKSRCSPIYAHACDYIERGIKVCDRWKDFENFLADMGERPEGLTLDRINNEGHYEPGNCRWATSSEQAKNKRTVGPLEAKIRDLEKQLEQASRAS